MAENEKQEAKQEDAKELVPLTEEQKQQEQEIERWYYRMERYPVPLPDKVKYMAARMAVAYGLDPFLGEMVFIPQYKGGDLVGYQPYVGIGGVRRAARRTGEYDGRELRPCTKEEREASTSTRKPTPGCAKCGGRESRGPSTASASSP